jgi:hypothetical protein
MGVYPTEVNTMSSEIVKVADTDTKKQQNVHIIRVAILAEEPLHWGSGKHFFPVILENYTWTTRSTIYTIKVRYVYDADILKGRLMTNEFDILLVPGGGVGDGQAVMKGIMISRNVRKWKKNISAFIERGGGYVGICGGTALMTDLKTKENKPRSFLEKMYDKSALGISCVSSYYPSLAMPLFYLSQKKYPERIGAISYVFSFAPGVTTDGVRVHTGGVPIDFQLCKDNPIFSDYPSDTERIRWWGGPALIVPENPNRTVTICAKYPTTNISEKKTTQIHAWSYTGGLHNLFISFLKALIYIKKEHGKLKDVFLYAYFMATGWRITNQIINLDYADKPSITTEIYPNENKGRILLCTSHPEYMVWWDGHITEMKEIPSPCLATGLYKWEGIKPLSPDAEKELTHTWWMVRRFVAWAAKVPDEDLPPIEKVILTKEHQAILSKNVFWDGSLKNQMENI